VQRAQYRCGRGEHHRRSDRDQDVRGRRFEDGAAKERTQTAERGDGWDEGE
jgi:hypothetical protein